MRTTCYYRIVLLLFMIQFFSFNRSNAQNESLEYDGVNDFVALPANICSSLTSDYTIECWVYWRGPSNSNWQRIIDIGTGTDVNMFLTTSNADTQTPRFAITLNTGPGEERISAPASLTLNQWHHIAVVVTVANTTGRLFIDGMNVATNSSMSLLPSNLGNTGNNYLGRSQYGGDPYFNGFIDEVRISNIARYTATFIPQQFDFAPDGNTLALYHFNESGGQTLLDASGNNQHATLGVSAAAEGSDPARSALTALPVGLSNFSAKRSGSAVHLEWKTDFEQNNRGFFIERSDNAVRYKTIAFVAGAGNSSVSNNYSYTDQEAGKNVLWYRLRQEDYDGITILSEIRSVPDQNQQTSLKWYPTGEGTVIVTLANDNSSLFRLMDFTGRVVRTGHLVEGIATLRPPAKGIYIISIFTQKNGIISARIVL